MEETHANTIPSSVANVEAIESFVSAFLNDNISKQHIFHDTQHTINVVNACKEIGEGYNLSAEEINLLQVAAWFHDTGYSQGAVDHESRSCHFAKEYLEKEGLIESYISKVLDCIQATKLPQQPTDLLEQILCDADMSHLGKKIYWNRCGRLREELILTTNQFVSDSEWIDFELDFMLRHEFHTTIAKEIFGKLKAKHIRQLYKQKRRLNPEESDSSVATADEAENQDALTAAFELKQLNLGRGVETMYRTTYRTHVNLSSIADNKANIMLSINAIIISIIISTLVPSLDSNPHLIIPAIILLIVCLSAMVFATLSTRPKITEGKFSREDIRNKRSNLLFFGNFYKMELKDFHWGMMEMIKDTDFLYSSMTRDIYYLGKVLGVKYRYLSICYGVFMYGLIASVIAFSVAIALKQV